MASKTLVAVAVALCCVTGSSATLINLINQCPYSVTAFARSGSSATNSYNLGASGGYQQLNVGSSFPAGLIFASTTGSEDNAQVWPYVLQHLSYTLVGTIPRTEGPPVLQATQLEITAGSNGRDYYDISLVVSKACAFCCLPWNIEFPATRARTWSRRPSVRFFLDLTCAWTRTFLHGKFGNPA